MTPFQRFGLAARLLAVALVVAVAQAAIADDHGNSPATATPVAPTSVTTGTFEVTGDVDYLAIDIVEPGLLDIAVSVGGSASPSVTLILPDATSRALSDTVATGIQDVIVDVGRYVLQIQLEGRSRRAIGRSAPASADPVGATALADDQYEVTTQFTAGGWSRIRYSIAGAGTLDVRLSPTAGEFDCPAGRGGRDRRCTEGEARIYDGSAFTLVYSPAPGEALERWEGCDVTNESSCEVTANGDRDVVAVTTVPDYLVTLMPNGPGTISDDQGRLACGAVCEAGYPGGTRLTLTATGLGDAALTSWPCGSEPTCEITVDSDRVISAVFRCADDHCGTTVAATTLTLDQRVFGSPTDIDNDVDMFVVDVPSDGTLRVTGTVISARLSVSLLDSTAAETGREVADGLAPSVDFEVTAEVGAGPNFIRIEPVEVEPNAHQVFYQFTASHEPGPARFPLTVVKDLPGGVVTDTSGSIDCGVTCSADFPGQSEVELTASTESGFRVGRWTGCDSATGSTCRVTLVDARTVSVTFVEADIGLLLNTIIPMILED
jgi:hypothetical protein